MYKLVGAEGPAHSPTFTSVVLIEGRRAGRGCGPSKKEAQTAAALDALGRLSECVGNDPGDRVLAGSVTRAATSPGDGTGTI